MIRSPPLRTFYLTCATVYWEHVPTLFHHHHKPFMGTNHYLHLQPDCQCCGRPFEPLHIGKSSYGWCYSLHVIPKLDIHTLDDWMGLWERQGACIRNEYGTIISAEEMLKIITERVHPCRTSWDGDWWKQQAFYSSEEDFHRQNHSERGPNFLLRSRIDHQHCTGHGDGTYDYIVGWFC